MAVARTGQIARQRTRPSAARPVFRLFPVTVTRVRRLSPSFARITLTADCLRGFGNGGDDQRIKVVLPKPGRTLDDFPDAPDWYQRWQQLPEATRPDLRTYTVRAFRPETRELDVDFVLHGVDHGRSGPASGWAANAQPGDRIGVIGPDAGTGNCRSGCEWSPPECAERLVLAGDETAVPAVGAILESLPADARGVACLEVPEAGDRQEWSVPDGVEVRWFARCGATPHGKLLEEGVAEVLRELPDRPRRSTAEFEDIDLDNDVLWEIPERSSGSVYGWLAGEASVIKRLRRMMVNEHGIPKQAVAFMGYWREGRC
ncbi:siderophore-interacting protein [Saccharopolyspora griseoalba]|uniref:Siderophore-interacting protein n=1 Tax=Saccharopolyspora griseoalba TaxID=1431848 RepID=A0ABW2LFH9_9PSEU